MLRALDHLRDTGGAADPRLAEALDLLAGKRQPDGTWLLEHSHPGAVHLTMEQVGQPSPWVTLRALRVLAWAGRGD